MRRCFTFLTVWPHREKRGKYDEDQNGNPEFSQRAKGKTEKYGERKKTCSERNSIHKHNAGCADYTVLRILAFGEYPLRTDGFSVAVGRVVYEYFQTSVSGFQDEYRSIFGNFNPQFDNFLVAGRIDDSV